MTIRAVYRNGVFTPDTPVSLPEGAVVDVTPRPRRLEEEIFAEFERRYPGVAGSLSDEGADELERIIEQEFGLGSGDDGR